MLAGRQQHARRLDEVAVRAVRLQPPRGLVEGLRGRPRRPVRHHRAARPASSKDTIVARPRSESATTRSGSGRTASARTGWKKLGDWVRGGGTLVAIGSAVETVRELLDLPDREGAARVARRRFGRRRPGRSGAGAGDRGRPRAARDVLEPRQPDRDAARSRRRPDVDLLLSGVAPAERVRRRIIRSRFGMPDAWPIFFEGDQAYRIRPGFDDRRPRSSRAIRTRGPILQSGWLLGEDLLRDQANVMAFRVGKGYVVAAGEPDRLPHAAARRPSSCCSTRCSTARRTRAGGAEIARMTTP